MKIIKIPKLGDELENLPYQIKDNKILVNYFGGVQAGFPSPAEDFVEQKLSLDEKYITNPNNTYLIKVRGNSMYPTLQIGDILIVKSDLDLKDNKIAIVSINNTDYTVKRYNKRKKMFVADNNEYPNIEIKEEDTILCLGVVKNLIRDL
jgi:DNA polymerase V